VLLEGSSSAIWRALTSGGSPILNGMDRHDVDTFLGELAVADLIVPRQSRASTRTQFPETQSPGADDGKHSAEFEREMMQWAWDHGFLFSAHLELTYRCNETCVHCYNPGAALSPGERPTRQRDELGTGEWKQIMGQLAEIGVFRLSLSGGEATLRKDFFELVAHARQLGFAVVIFTNGLQGTPDFVEKVAHLWPHSVEVSIYSANSELHDRITGVPGSFQRSVDCLTQLNSAGVRTTMKTTLMSTTVGGYADCRVLSESLGSSLVMDINISPNLDGREAPLQLAPDFETLVALAASPASPTTVLMDTDAPPRWDKNSPVCGAGTKTLSISPEGGITPCTAMPWNIGTARNGNLAKLWRNAIAHRGNMAPDRQASSRVKNGGSHDLSDWQSITLGDFDECGTHERCRWCQEICPGDALVLSGNPLAAAAHRCKAASARMAAAQILASGHTTPSASVPVDRSPLTKPRSSFAAFPIFRLHPNQDGEEIIPGCKA